jgi:hypothetical protein
MRRHPASQLVWTDESRTGLDRLVLTRSAGRIVATGHVNGPEATPFEVDYRVECDESWQTRLVRISDAAGGRIIELRATGDGTWTDGGNAALPHLNGAIDVDISATPFTNTLPIRRLELAIGDSADIRTAYIAVPEFTVSADPQRYTRTAERTYRYDSLDSDFTRDVTVDQDGFVLDYPGLFHRQLDGRTR